MKWIGINIDLLIRVREEEIAVESVQPINEYDFGFLTAADIEDMIRLEPGTAPEKLDMWFREGKLCYGIRDHSRLIAKMWCDLDELYHPTCPQKLAVDEVYLFLAYVDPDYRG